MTKKAKPNKPDYYTIDFTTALPVADCRRRLERSATQAIASGSPFAPITQQIAILQNDQFIIERSFPGAIRPIRLMGALDDDPDGGSGTWVHGAITHDTENQVLIEGLIVFLGFFLLAALLFVRLKTRAFVISVPMLVAMLTILSLRWRALRSSTRDLAVFLRRRFYLTEAQVKQGAKNAKSRRDERSEPHADSYAQPDDQPRTHRHGTNGH